MNTVSIKNSSNSDIFLRGSTSQLERIDMKLVKKSIKVYPHTNYNNRKVVNSLRRRWIKQMQYLGDKWILAKSIQRKDAK